MKKYKIYKILFLLMAALNIYDTNAQDNATESRTIKVKKGLLSQIDFTTQVSADFTLPKNSTDYFELGYTKAGRSLIITTKQETLPPTTLTVAETNGKKWTITIEYKEDIDLENESNYDFSDNNIKTTQSNIVLSETDRKLSLEKQTEALPYSISEMNQLTKIYPQIDFAQPPPEQTINLAYTDNDAAFIDDLYNSRPELNQAFKNDMVNIRVVCQNLRFNGTNAYLKILVQNDGTENFLTGAMLLSLLRENGTSLSLHPGSIYPNKFPIIKPKSQIALIYAFKAYDVSEQDNLKFEIQDRLQKINLELKIAGSVYYAAKKD